MNVLEYHGGNNDVSPCTERGKRLDHSALTAEKADNGENRVHWVSSMKKSQSDAY
jgi:hypothetical protein